MEKSIEKSKMNLAIVGIRGIPNTYGGFETLVENLVEHLSEDFKITVFCSSVDMESSLKSYKGASLEYIPVTSHGALGILYDSIGLLKAAKKYDKILFLGFGGGFAIPLLKKYKSKIVLNIGGLDWKRNKWSPLAQKVIKKAEELLVKNSGKIISDNIGIQEYILQHYKRQSTLITYGGDQANHQQVTNELTVKYPFLKKDYAFIVTRIQSDNNIEMLLEAFDEKSPMPLVMVGNWLGSPYGKKIKEKYLGKPNLILLDAIYNRLELDVLRSNCTVYIHGHSAGGTNPSLVEAMYLGLPIFAFASGYNEHTTENKAVYFKSANELSELISKYKNIDLDSFGKEMQEIAQRSYRWGLITDKYKEVFAA